MNSENVKDDKPKSIEQRIIEAAQVVFIRKGFIATSMGDVAAEANVGRTSLNYYYRTKDILFDAMVNNFAQRLFPNIEKIIEEETSVLEKLPHILTVYFNLIKNNPALPLFIINEINRDTNRILTPILKSNYELTVFLRLKNLVLKEMEEGKLRKQSIEDVASAFVSLVIFPFLIKDLLLRLFMNEDKTSFDNFLDRKKEQIEEIMTNLLKIEEK